MKVQIELPAERWKEFKLICQAMGVSAADLAGQLVVNAVASGEVAPGNDAQWAEYHRLSETDTAPPRQERK